MRLLTKNLENCSENLIPQYALYVMGAQQSAHPDTQIRSGMRLEDNEEAKNMDHDMQFFAGHYTCTDDLKSTTLDLLTDGRCVFTTSEESYAPFPLSIGLAASKPLSGEWVTFPPVHLARLQLLVSDQIYTQNPKQILTCCSLRFFRTTGTSLRDPRNRPSGRGE